MCAYDWYTINICAKMNNCIYLYEILEVKISESYFQTYVPFCFESDGNNNRILIFFTLFKIIIQM